MHHKATLHVRPTATPKPLPTPTPVPGKAAKISRDDAKFWTSEHDACQDAEIEVHRAAAYASGGERDEIADEDLSGQDMSTGEIVHVVGLDTYDCVMSADGEDHHVPIYLSEINRDDGSHGYTEQVNISQ